MLTHVEVFNSQGANLTLPLMDASAGFLVKNIDGLDPVKATIVSSNFANMDGSQRQSSRRENRNLVITLGLRPNYDTTSVQSLRNLLYKFFMPKSQIKLRFFFDGVQLADIQGDVESFTSSLFSADPEVAISVLCFDPDFLAIEEGSFAGTTTSGFSSVAKQYDGTIETGFKLHMVLNHDVTSFSLSVSATGEADQTLDFELPMFSTQTVELSTEPGNKYITWFHGAADSVLYAMDPASSWPKLKPGNNLIRLKMAGIANPFTITYTTRYGGF